MKLLKKLFIILLLLTPIMCWGQTESYLLMNRSILIFNNTILSPDTVTPPVSTIACDSIVPCDAIIPCDAVYTSYINSLRINKNNYTDDFYKHEETLIV